MSEMAKCRFTLHVTDDDRYDEQTDVYEGQTLYEMQMLVAPGVACDPAQPAREFIRGAMYSTDGVLHQPRLIKMPATPARCYSVDTIWQRGVLMDWVLNRARIWTAAHGWDRWMPIDRWVALGSWRV